MKSGLDLASQESNSEPCQSDESSAVERAPLPERIDLMTRQEKERLLLRLQEQRRKSASIRRQVVPVARREAKAPGVETMSEEAIRQSLARLLRPAPRKLAEVAAQLPRLSAEQCGALLEKLLQRSWEGATRAQLSFAQQRCWFSYVLDPSSPAQNIAAAVRVSGPMDFQLLERSLNVIIARHETLRTNFVAFSDGPAQVIFPGRLLAITHVDLCGAVRENGEAALYEAIRAEAYRCFDLGAGPLLRVSSFRTGPSEYVLLLTMHHIIGDEWSIGILLQELGLLYGTQCQKLPPPLLIQYADYCEWQLREITPETVQGDLAFWRKQLAGAPLVLEVPPDRPRPPIQTNNGAWEALQLDRESIAGLRSVARSAECTNFMVLLAVCYVLLHARTGQDDIVLGTDFANRNRPETAGLIGLFVNELALRCVLGGDPPFLEIAKRARAAFVAAVSHPEAPFQWVVEDLGRPRDPARGPIFQVVFDLHNVPMRLELGGISLEPMRVPVRPAKFDLTLFIGESGTDTHALLEYNTDLYDKETARQLLRDYSRAIALAAGNASLRLTQLRAALSPGNNSATRAG